MTKNPFINTLAALLYITAVASGIFYSSKMPDLTPSIIIPIAMLSLLVLSVAIMAYLFFFKPVQLYFDDEKKNAADLFLKTLGIFTCITAILLLTLFLKSIFLN